MLFKNRILPLMALLLCIEVLIYAWAVWTTEPEFVFDKCARNSGRASSLINLLILLMAGHYGLKRIYEDDLKKQTFRTLLSIFAFNHLIHFFYVFMNFKSHTMVLSMSENLHGFITFIFIVIVPFVLWTVKRMNLALSIALLLHLFNVSYFIMETFLSKVKPDRPAYHNQLGILITSCAILYMIYRFLSEQLGGRPSPVN